MSLSILTTPPDTEQPFFIPGPVGVLEAIFYPAKEQSNQVAVLCHPHPLHEGSMNNKVIHTLSRAFHRKGIHSIRFNYRGVGKSEGLFGDSIGEIEDAKAVVAWLKKSMPSAQWYFSGFSFGSYIAARCAQDLDCKQLISIAPAVHHQPYQDLSAITCPWVVIQGESDEIVPPEKVYQWFEQADQQSEGNMQLIKLAGASHFFHGKLIELRTIVMDVIS